MSVVLTFFSSSAQQYLSKLSLKSAEAFSILIDAAVGTPNRVSACVNAKDWYCGKFQLKLILA